MYKEIAWPVSAIHIDGHVLTINNFDELYDFRWTKHGHFGQPWGERHYDWSFRFSDGNYLRERMVVSQWIMRDFFGAYVPYENVAEEIRWRTRCGYAKRRINYSKQVRACMEKGLPIPGTGCRKAGWKQNAPAKKNSGRKHRKRNIARAIYEAAEYGVPNKVGNAVKKWN